MYKAKGNEAAVVYVVGVDSVQPFLSDVRMRNRLFTALTRSKGWIRISGIGDSATKVFKEVNAAKSEFPYFEFAYPDPTEIQTIQRDLSAKSAKLQELQLQLFTLRQQGITREEIESVTKSAIASKDDK